MEVNTLTPVLRKTSNGIGPASDWHRLSPVVSTRVGLPLHRDYKCERTESEPVFVHKYLHYNIFTLLAAFFKINRPGQIQLRVHHLTLSVITIGL